MPLTQLIAKATELIDQTDLNFIGNVEGRDLYAGGVDVIICEGFVGNVILKVSEGMADFLFKAVTPEVVGRLNSERAIATRLTRSDLRGREPQAVVGGVETEDL